MLATGSQGLTEMLEQPPKDSGTTTLMAAPVDDTPRRLLDELLSLGFEPEVTASDLGLAAGGAGFRLSVRELHGAPRDLERDTGRVRALLMLGIPVAVTVGDARRPGEPRIERVLRALHRATTERCIDRRRLALAINAADLELPAFLLSSRSWLGDGPRFVLLDGGGAAAAAGLWSALYQQRNWRRGLRPAAACAVHSACPLLADEAGSVPVSRHALLAPPGSAWLPLALNVCRYCDRRGVLRTAALYAALRRGLALADRLFDLLHWPEDCMRRDAAQNRRIVVVVQGLGDLVLLRRADPAGIDALRDLDRLVEGMHSCLSETTRRLAAERGLLPALAGRDPSRRLEDAAERHRWQRRWQEALAGAAVRHRNLLALSPYSLLPRSAAAAGAWLDLLPLLAHADVLSFAGGASFTNWNIRDYKAFHGRAAAILGRRNRTAFVATGV